MVTTPQAPELTAEAVLLDLVNVIDATGGVIRDDTSPFGCAPVGDTGWTDLGDTYLQACKVLKREPKFAEVEEDDFYEPDDEPDDLYN
jgi:hypothetical protein